MTTEQALACSLCYAAHPATPPAPPEPPAASSPTASAAPPPSAMPHGGPAMHGHVGPPVYVPAQRLPMGQDPAYLFVRRLADYQKWSGVGWIALGVLQVLTVIGAIAGIWNIFAGITRIRASQHIAVRNPQVPHAFKGVAQLAIIAVINLVFGGVIGLILVAVDFYVRDQVLKNAHLFDNAAALPPAPQMATPGRNP